VGWTMSRQFPPVVDISHAERAQTNGREYLEISHYAK